MAGLVFGKLPAHGDFVARGLGAADRDDIDAWLVAAMRNASTVWGDTFEYRFDQAIPLRCDGQGVSGALAASQDRAGRRYPVLALGAEGEAERIEQLLYDAIADAWIVDRLADAIGVSPAGPINCWFRDAGPILSGAMPGDLLVEMLR